MPHKAMELSDPEVIDRIRHSSPDEKKELFLILYDRYKSIVLKSCYYYLGDYETSKDVFHDVFIKVMEKVETIKNPSVFKSWMMTIVRNSCVDCLRRTSYLKGQEPLDIYLDIALDERVEDNMIAELDKQKVLTQLSACIQQMDPFEIKVFRLRWQGLKAAQILEILTTDKLELRRCYDRIKSLMERCMQRKGFVISMHQILSLGETDE